MATDDKRKKTMAMFDTVTGSNEGTEIEIQTPEGDPSGVKIRILGPDSDEAIRVSRQIQQKNTKLFQKNNGNKVDVVQDQIDTLTAITVGWSGMPGDDGKERQFSKEAARDIYTRYPHVRREVAREHEDTRNFIKA